MQFKKQAVRNIPSKPKLPGRTKRPCETGVAATGPSSSADTSTSSQRGMGFIHDLDDAAAELQAVVAISKPECVVDLTKQLLGIQARKSTVECACFDCTCDRAFDHRVHFPSNRQLSRNLCSTAIPLLWLRMYKRAWRSMLRQTLPLNRPQHRLCS